MKGNDRLPPEFREPAPGGPTAIIRYSLRAEILVIGGREPPLGDLPRRPRNGKHREPPLVAPPVQGGPHDDRHWADLGL
jgi:hypothetical protein